MSRTKLVETLAVRAKRMNVYMFLQYNPQDKYIEDLMKKKYAREIHTESEWNEILAKELGHKIVS